MQCGCEFISTQKAGSITFNKFILASLSISRARLKAMNRILSRRRGSVMIDVAACMRRSHLEHKTCSEYNSI